MTAQQYIILFLLGDTADGPGQHVFYGRPDAAPAHARIIIQSTSFFDDGVYGTAATQPKVPLAMLPDSDIPFLFGESRLERTEDGRFVLYADLVASAYFMLSRYEEIIKPGCRDKWGRFLAKDSVVFQQGYGLRPLVDEWGLYLRDLLRKAGIDMPEEKRGFRKIYLTHDVDVPFRFFSLRTVLTQWKNNLLHKELYFPRPLRQYFHPDSDPYNTFQSIIDYEAGLKAKYEKVRMEVIYFIIARGGILARHYCNIRLWKFKRLLSLLANSGATLGLHASHEAGMNPSLLGPDMKRLLRHCPLATTKSRHHYLRWREPEHVEQMEAAGISEDFTLEYADSAGFRVGTSSPYYFINPRTRRVTKVLIHPMQIMECSLDDPAYMDLKYGQALEVCKRIADETYKHNGELVLLWHNTSFLSDYHKALYKDLTEYVFRKTDAPS